MCRLGRVVEFFVVTEAAAHDVVLVGLGQRLEVRQVVLPQLKRSKAGTIGSDRCLHRILVHRVLSAVFVPGQVQPTPVQETVNAVGQAQGRRQRLLQCLGPQQQVAPLIATQPQPQRMLGAGVLYRRIQQRERTQARYFTPQGFGHGRAYAQNHLHAIDLR